MSIILNFIEGYARRKSDNCKVYTNFLETSYGSFKESKYLVFFSYSEKWINEYDYKHIMELGDRIGAMLYGTINKNRKTR